MQEIFTVHTSDKKIWDYMNQFAEFNNYINSPVAVYKDELYNLPFNMNTFSKMWNIRTPPEAKEIIEKQRKETGITDPQNLEEQALFLGGRDIYEKLIKGYTEKQWGRKCTELPAFIIKRLQFRFVYDNNYFNDRYQGIPVGGYTAIVEKMLEGTEVRTGIDFLIVRTIREMLLSITQSVKSRIQELSSISILSLASRRRQLFPESIHQNGVSAWNHTIR